MPGKLIVFEGTDGSGKSTQFARLCQRLEEEGKAFQRLIFPQYDKPSSTLLRMYLQGEFGSRPEDVNPYAASTFYAVDRYASLEQCHETAAQAADCLGWRRVPCVDGAGELRTIEDLHEEIWDMINREVL